MEVNDSLERAVAYRARWVVPVERPPIEGGVVTIAGGRIVAVGRNDSYQPAIELGDVALLPGLVNAHTHLEFSLSGQLGEPGMPFAQWLAEVVNLRAQNTQNATSSEDRQCSRVMEVVCGLVDIYDTGTAVVGEIAQRDFPLEEYDLLHQPLDLTFFGELIGLAAERTAPLLEQAGQYLWQNRTSACQRLGLSPHAPYTVHPELLRQVCSLSAEARVPVAMHLAESRDELELLAAQTGPLVEFLKSLGAWHPEAIPFESAPLDYLKHLAVASRALVIHGNYLNSAEIEFLAQQREAMSVVYCPRTHAYFRHEPYPLAAMLRKGVRVAVGTDSRASNPDLNLLEELRQIAARHPAVDPDDVLKMGTLWGAEALGRIDQFGTIAVGKSARLAVVAVDTNAPSPYEALLTAARGSARPLAQFAA